MENILDEKEPEAIHLTDQEIFTTIWTSPRQVFKFINDNQYDKHATLLLILAGISSAFDRAVVKNMGDQMSLVAIVALCIVLGGDFWLVDELHLCCNGQLDGRLAEWSRYHERYLKGVGVCDVALYHRIDFFHTADSDIR